MSLRTWVESLGLPWWKKTNPSKLSSTLHACAVGCAPSSKFGLGVRFLVLGHRVSLLMRPRAEPQIVWSWGITWCKAHKYSHGAATELQLAREHEWRVGRNARWGCDGGPSQSAAALWVRLRCGPFSECSGPLGQNEMGALLRVQRPSGSDWDVTLKRPWEPLKGFFFF